MRRREAPLPLSPVERERFFYGLFRLVGVWNEFVYLEKSSRNWLGSSRYELVKEALWSEWDCWNMGVSSRGFSE